MSLDADEALSETLKISIKEWKQKNSPFAGSFNRLTNYCGKWIKHSGWYPDVKTRIFNRTYTHWEGSIHEELIFNQAHKVVHLKGDCLHYSYYSINQHKEQALKFSKLWARTQHADGRKSSLLKIVYKPLATFLKAYFIHFGFLDGSAGFTIARISAGATFIRYSMLYTLNKQ